MRIAYIQSIGGASGDMLLGALLDLGLSLETLQSDLNKLDISGYELQVTQDTRCEMRGTKLNVKIQDPTRYTPRFLLDTVINSRLSEGVKTRSGEVLSALWRAECRVHGESEEVLELEELGSVDTLVDVVGVVSGLEQLGVERVYAAPLVLGESTPPRWAGGYSNPAPATLELVAMSAAPVVADLPLHQGAGELTTPTGASLITTLAEFQRPAFSVTGVGVGLGTKDPEGFPNAIRVWLGETAEQSLAGRQGGIILLETNLDDVSGELVGYAQEQLFALGALDVWYTPIQMKKNRPGVMLSAMVPQELETAAFELILRETTTLGVRTRPVERYVAERHIESMESVLGVIGVKVKYLGGKAVSASPEYEDCRKIALESGISLQDVYQQAMAEARRQYLA
ncbi:MAG TPA: nickel pincer cofactor biosynthesis protein LarC [Dehalococcoidia bacterium]|nr:nickel pincer cofactor biosynthesis protein LarC [Dehalococcoidia bacterium]